MTAFFYRSDRMLLREFVAGDAADVMRLHADPRVRALLPDEQPLHEAHWAAEFAARLPSFYRRHPGLGIWRCALPRHGGEQFAGWFSLMPFDAGPGSAELGSRLLPEQWGGGLSLHGGEVLLRHAFETLALDTVWGVCHPDNRGARVCLEALGFAPRGRALYEGQPSDHHALDATTWSTVQALSRRERLRQVRRAARPSTTAAS